MTRKIKDTVKKGLRSAFVIGQQIGVSVLPYHFYSQIPNIKELSGEQYWRNPMSMVGIDGSDIAEQIQCLSDFCQSEFLTAVTSYSIHEKAVKENGESSGYGVIEADILYCFIRRHQPKKIIQVGCGVSTAVILMAARDANYQPKIVCVEPYPMPYLVNLQEKGHIILVKEKAQKVSLNQLIDIGRNDFLFVDSTHTVKPGSEVNRIILEVLPRLGPETWIHFHDIYFPYDYGRKLLSEDLFFWSESTLLHAFLIHNAHCKLKLSQSMLHYHVPEKLSSIFPHYDPQDNNHGLKGKEGKHFPSATYLQTH